ncbi:hypothetical protein IPA_06130 [Ignicoccus pacificus DSM 13166]|uniref:Uncharacterized protein n=1 Tax=Ignicoccus pacificus DSM 13166 TaxID=940294 RepID=A0A977PL14_9CREN|nr:hypothetical protein IPA_06130 [Ignicoccus pacificus DSM 13166]
MGDVIEEVRNVLTRAKDMLDADMITYQAKDNEITLDIYWLSEGRGKNVVKELKSLKFFGSPLGELGPLLANLVSSEIEGATWVEVDVEGLNCGKEGCRAHVRINFGKYLPLF